MARWEDRLVAMVMVAGEGAREMVVDVEADVVVQAVVLGAVAHEREPPTRSL